MAAPPRRRLKTLSRRFGPLLRFQKSVIADSSGRNLNVFYEIGLAHAIGVPVILITRSSDDVPFDLRHRR
jgi:hypothetical protein